jgi:hypothetical protein
VAEAALAPLPEAAVLPVVASVVFPLFDVSAVAGAFADPLDWELCARSVPPHTIAAHTIPIAIL